MFGGLDIKSGFLIVFFLLNVVGLGFIMFVFLFVNGFFVKLLGSFFKIDEIIRVVKKIFKGCVINVFWKNDISMDESYLLDIFFFYCIL